MALDIAHGCATHTWTLGRVLGRGSFAAVYEGEQPGGWRAAIKVVTSDHPQALPRFRREVEVLQRLPPNPYVVTYLDHGVLADGREFLAMELVRGFTLAHLLGSGLYLTESAACTLMLELCQAFEEIHALGLAHCDLKPANIMLARRPGVEPTHRLGGGSGPVHAGQLAGAGMHVKVLDFGLVRDCADILAPRSASEERLESDAAAALECGVVGGTLAYMPPELIWDARQPDPSRWLTTPAADVFSLGVIFYELLRGQSPWPFRVAPGAGDREVRFRAYLDARASGGHAARPIDGIGRGLWRILARTLEIDPRDRPATAADLRAEIQHYMDFGSGVAQRSARLTPSTGISMGGALGLS